MEQVRMLPGVHAHAGHADGQVALERHPVHMGIRHRILELPVQQILQVAVEVHFGGILPGEGKGLPPVITAPFAPRGKIRRAVAVPEDAEHGIREEPLLVGVHERLILGGSGRLLPLGTLEEFPQKRELGLRDGLVIDGRQGLQGLFPGLVGRILTHAGVRQMDIHRMQRERAHGIIRIGILPGMGHRRIVDREDLDDALPGLHGPVHQFPDIVEFTHAETVLRPEGENGNGNAGPAPGADKELRIDIGDGHVAAFRRHFPEEMVRPFLPGDRLPGFRVHDDKLVFENIRHFQGRLPIREAPVVQQVENLPFAQGLPAARQGDGFAGAHFGHGDAESHVPLPGRRGTRIPEGGSVRTAEDDVAEGMGIKGGIHGAVRPPFPQDEELRLRRCSIVVAAPFGPDGLPVPLHFESVAVAVAEVPSGQVRLPDSGKGRHHRVTFLPDPEHEAFARGGMVMKDDSDVHIFELVIVPFPARALSSGPFAKQK